MFRGYVGGLGSGKSYSMCDDATQWMRTRRGQIYTNMAGLRCPEAIYIDSLKELLYVSSGLVLLDEASVALASRFWQEVPREMLTRFAQFRKHGLDLWYTTQHENRVDTVVREITNENVVCHKFGGGHFRRVMLPGEKKPLRTTFHRFRPEIFAIYDTLEVIGTHGGSVGRGETATRLSAVARKTQDEDARRQAREARRSEIPMRRWEGNTIVFLPDAEKAYQWLLAGGLLDAAEPVSVQLQRELRRRRWLRTWGLGPEDAPFPCNGDAPWLSGCSPAEVRERNQVRDIAGKVEEVIEFAKTRSSSAPRTGRRAF